MQTGTKVWLKERDWDTGQTSVGEPGSHAGVEHPISKYGMVGRAIGRLRGLLRRIPAKEGVL